MFRSRCLTLIAAGLLAALATALPGKADAPAIGTPGMAVVSPAVLLPVEDPFPIARVRVTEAQLAEAVKPFGPGVLVRLPRDEFEARVRAAGLAATSARSAPRLLKAEYKAALAGGDLTGTAEWTILNPSPRPAAFPLDPLRLAIRSPVWADGKEAIVGVLGAGFPSGPVVWVEGTGRQVLKFTWSLAGTSGPDERQFDLRVPPCVGTVLDLELPAGRSPGVTSADVLVTGPTPAADPARQAWRLRPGDRPRLEFAVRTPGEATPAGAVLASLAATYDLTEGQAFCTFDFDLRPARGSVGEWAFQLDPGLQITDVVMTNRSGWRVDPATRQLRVTLRQPGPGGRASIKAVLPLPPRGPATRLPAVRPLGAVTGDERIEVRVHPDVRLESWDPGDYQPAESTLGPDQVRTVSLVGTLLPAGTDVPYRRMPVISTSASDVEFTTAEGVEWRVERGRVRVTARVIVRVRRGPLFQVAFRAPQGFSLGRVGGTPDTLLTPVDPARGPSPTVEFTRPLSAGQSVELHLEFLGPPLAGAGPRRVPFPHVVPVGAAERDGWLRVVSGPAWSISPHPQPGAMEATGFGPPDPPLPETDDAVVTYLFRGKEPDGEMVLCPVRPVFTAETTPPAGSGTSRITVHVEAGELNTITVFERGTGGGDRTWRLIGDGSNTIVSAAPLSPGPLPAVFPLLAAPVTPLTAVVAARTGLTAEPGTYWVLRFARPVADRVTLETTARGTMTVRGAQQTTAQPEPAVGTARPPVPGPQPPTGWSFGDLYLLTVASNDTSSLIAFGGTIAARGGVSLPLGLPAGARVRAACVGGHWLDPGRCAPEPGSSELRLPIPAGNGPVRFEVRYRLPVEGGWAARSVRSPVPGLPGGPHEIRHWWVFSGGVLPAWPHPIGGWHPAADLPPLLGAPLDQPGSIIASGFAGVQVLAIPARLAEAGGFALATVLALVGWLGVWRGWAVIGLALLVVVLGCGIAVLLGPPAWERAGFPPLIVGLLAAAVCVVVRGWGRAPRDAPRPTRPALVATAITVLSTLPLVGVHARPAARDVAFLLPGPVDQPDRETVVAPKSLLDKLAAVGAVPTPTTAITTARYTGRVEGGVARVTARFVAHSFIDGEASVSLPLADARLERVTVGGNPAHPIAVRPDLYSVAVPGCGRHEIEVRFTIPVTGTAPDREVRFGIPDVSDSRLSITLPVPARQPQAVGRLGGQRVANESEAVRLDADLGGVRAVQVRWRQGAGRAAVASVREGCVWDVSETGAKLTACYQVRVDQGAVADLRFNLPRELEVVRVTVRRLDGPAGAVMRGWTIGPERSGARPLRIDLQDPTEGRMLVVLEVMPRSPPTHQPMLRFPQPTGMTHQGGIYGLRVSRLLMKGVERGGVIDFAADALVREFGSVLDLQPGPGVQVQAFSPRIGEPAWLRPTLRPPAEPWAATQEVTWRVAAHRADVTGLVRWTDDGLPPVLEFDVPEIHLFGARLPRVRVLEVRGPDVIGWSQVGGRVVVWLRKTDRGETIEWVGVATPVPRGQPVPQPLVFEPTVPRMVGVKTAIEILKVMPTDGWAVRVERDRGWAAVPPGDRREWVFRSDGPVAPPRLLLYAPRGGPAAGFGMVEWAGETATYRATLERPVRAGRPHHLVLRAMGLPPGAAAELDLPPGTTAVDRVSSGASREWGLDVPATSADTFRVSVVLRFPAGVAPVHLPTVDLRPGGGSPGVGVVRWVGVVGSARGVLLDGASPVSPAGLDRMQAGWPGEAERLRRAGGSVWEITLGSRPTLRIEQPPSRPPSPTQQPGGLPPDIQRQLPVADDATTPLDRRPVVVAVAWCLAMIGLISLHSRFPLTTWPEQLGLVAGLLGFAVSGEWGVGLPVVVAARLVWLVRAFSFRIPRIE